MTTCVADVSFPSGELTTLVDLLRWRAVSQPARHAYTFLADGEVAETRLTYAELDQQARAIAASLQGLGATGQRALLLYPPGCAFLAAFYGCLYAGTLAVPLPAPEASRLKRALPRLQAVVHDAQAMYILTTARLMAALEKVWDRVGPLPAVRWLATDDMPSQDAPAWRHPAIHAETLAYLQYTSGSTSTPKGVMVSHANLMHHSAYIRQAWGYTPESIATTWMPHFHDYGLVDGLIQPLYAGIPCYIMSPMAFLKRPVRWLQVISRYQATHSQGPDFAYDYCVRKIPPAQRGALDLRSWRVAGNGGEPNRRDTVERFIAAFAPYGFRPEAFYPSYGLAEATLVVATKRPADPPRICTVLADALAHHRVREAAPHHSGVRAVVSCGPPVGAMHVVIAHPDTLQPCAPDEVGEICVADASVAQGYWHRPEETAQTFHAYLAGTGTRPFLRTGDLGFLQDGELFVTGRLKDVVIIRGQNYYPQDLEATVEQSHPALRAHCGAAFAVHVDGAERLVVVQEVERSALLNLHVDAVIGAIRHAVWEQHAIQTYAVVLLKTGTIPKTSSGKIQRHACRQGFLEDTLSAAGAWRWTMSKRTESDTARAASPMTLHTPLYHAPGTSAASGHVTTTAAHRMGDTEGSKARADDIIQWLRRYADERVNSRLIDERRCIPPYIVLDFGNRGVLGLQVPEQYGGMALHHCDTLRVFEQLAALDLTLATFVIVNDVLGTRPIVNYATPMAQETLLPLIAQGRELAAFAYTEPGAGSNPRGIAATAVPDGRGGWRLRGQKAWIGSAAWAGVMNVFVQQLDAQHQPVGISGFVVRQGTEGLRQGPEALTMGMRGMVQNSIYLDDVPVGPEQMLGQPGSGMDGVALDTMMYTRLVMAAVSVGGMKRCAQLMQRYATRRSIATGRLLENPVTLLRMSELIVATTAVEVLVRTIGALLDAGCPVPEDAFVACKTSGPELLWQAANTLVQLLGGRGYIETNFAPQLLRDARIFRIFEGPTETLNMYLGSRVLHRGAALQQFLSTALEAPDVAQRLQDAAEQIRQRCVGPAAPFTDRSTALRWSHILTGEVATTALLLAAVQKVARRGASDSLRLAMQWAQHRFDRGLARALTGTPAEAALCDAETITRRIAAYTDAIGDIEQALAGEDHALDLLLQKAASTPHADGPPQSVPSLTTAGTALHPPEHEQMALSSPEASHTVTAIQTWIEAWLTAKLDIDPKALDPHRSFADYGLDSVTAVELALELEEWLALAVEATVVWNFPNIASLAQHLAQERSGAVSTSDAQTAPPVARDTTLAAAVQQLSETQLEASIAQEVAELESLLGEG